MSHQQKLEKLIGKDIVNNLNSATVDTKDKRTKIIETLDSMDISDDKKADIKKSADSYINKTHGTLKEWNAIEMYQKKFGVTLVGAQQFNKYYLENISKNSLFDWYICGKVDGLYLDQINSENNYIVEVKNRMHGFFSTVRDYENTQIQLYTFMLNIQRAKLVEKYENKLRITQIYQDLDYINDILSYLGIFITNFEEKFLKHEDTKINYINKSNDEKQIFLRRLYLNDINTDINKKVENTINDDEDDCMIDDLD